MRKFWAAKVGGSVVVLGKRGIHSRGQPGFGSSTLPHIRHMRTDTAGLSSAGAHEFTSNEADAYCPTVTRQRVERGVGYIEGMSMDPACARSLRTTTQRDSARQEESIETTLVLNGEGLTLNNKVLSVGGVGRPRKGGPGGFRGMGSSTLFPTPPPCLACQAGWRASLFAKPSNTRSKDE